MAHNLPYTGEVTMGKCERIEAQEEGFELRLFQISIESLT
jgi:hypothetical protein